MAFSASPKYVFFLIKNHAQPVFRTKSE